MPSISKIQYPIKMAQFSSHIPETKKLIDQKVQSRTLEIQQWENKPIFRMDKRNTFHQKGYVDGKLTPTKVFHIISH